MTISRRFFLQTAAGSLAVASNAQGQTVTAGDPTAPWAAAPAASSYADPRIRALAWAILAPNPHNRQPWIAELPRGDADTVILRCDLDRRLPVTDPFDRQITIGLGAFAELFRMAAAEDGFAATISAFPDGDPRPRLDARPVAVMRLAPGGVADPLFAHAAARRSAKLPFDMAQKVSVESLAALAATASAPIRFGATNQPAQVEAIRDLAWRAWGIESQTEGAHLESVNLMRLGRADVAANPDGISIYGPGLDQAVAAGQITRGAMLPGRPGFDIMVNRYRPMLANTNAYVWSSSAGNSRAEAFWAGRDWLRLNLAATGMGLALHPVSQTLQEFPEMAGPYSEAQALLGQGGVAQMLGRVGYLPGPPPGATPRWPMETRIRTT